MFEERPFLELRKFTLIWVWKNWTKKFTIKTFILKMNL